MNADPNGSGSTSLTLAKLIFILDDPGRSMGSIHETSWTVEYAGFSLL